MKKETITKLVAAAAIAVSSITSGVAQTNLGASCGCPPVASRPSVLLSTLATVGGANDGSLTAATTILDCSKNWILDKKIFVDNGKTLLVHAGTVIKGRKYSTSDSAVALIVSRGAKMIADGNYDCPIVMTAEADPMDGSYPIANNGQWGGLVIAGRATNNLTLAADGPYTAGAGNGKLAVANGLGYFEGFATVDPRMYFGADLTGSATGVTETFDDNDNSGVFRYLSVRYSGAILNIGGEINAISLGSVGRGTTIEHIEVISTADDNMEFWGGTVQVKYAAFMFSNDDNYDFDDGYSGKAQFVFAVKSSTQDTLTSSAADNGFECDADDDKSNNFPRSHPVFYNCTMIGNNKKILTSDNSGIAGIEAKELTEGEFYNCVFANFRYGFNVIKSLGTRAGSEEAWMNWSNTSGTAHSGNLKVKCNVFVDCQHPIAIDKNNTGILLSSDTAQFYTTDMNKAVTSIPGFNYTWSMSGTTNAVATQFDATPNPGLSTAGCPTPPADGFFTPVTYKGAFDPNGKNWLSTWSYAQLLNTTGGLVPCPTDINQDGITNNADFLLLLAQYNVSCH
ncbi:MAG: hypothetical protein ABI388_07620 [Bacteroidia bacterium]